MRFNRKRGLILILVMVVLMQGIVPNLSFALESGNTEDTTIITTQVSGESHSDEVDGKTTSSTLGEEDLPAEPATQSTTTQARVENSSTEDSTVTSPVGGNDASETEAVLETQKAEATTAPIEATKSTETAATTGEASPEATSEADPETPTTTVATVEPTPAATGPEPTTPTPTTTTTVEEAGVIAVFEENGLRVEVEAEPGVLPAGVVVRVKPVAEEDELRSLDILTANTDLFISTATLLDISLLDAEGNEVQPNGTVKVTIQGLDFINGEDETFVYHIDLPEASEEVEEGMRLQGLMSTTEESLDPDSIESFESESAEGEISFDTTHFSIYIVGTNTRHENSNNRYQMDVGDTVRLVERNDYVWYYGFSTNAANIVSLSEDGDEVNVTAIGPGNVAVRYQTGGFLSSRYNYFYIEVATPPSSPPAEYPGDPTRPEIEITTGEVRASKTAVPVPGTVNTWDITVRIEADDPESITTDIILVIDNSGSMADDQRLVNAKIAATNFINKFVNDNNVGIGVVSFAATASTRAISNTVSGKNAHSNYINGLNASGGTFTQAAIKAAQNMLDSIPTGQRADRQFIVILSDGEPTYSYGMTSENLRRNNTYFERYQNTSNWYSRDYYAISPFNYGTGTSGRVGNGFAVDFPDTNFPYMGSSGSNSFYYHHANHTIAEGRYAKLAGSIVFTIAYQSDAEGERVLQNVATAGNYYVATTATVDDIFNEIAVSISGTILDGTIKDVMGDGFEIPAHRVAAITASQGTVQYDAVTKTLDWDLGGNLLGVVPGNSSVKFAEITYTVEINEEMVPLNEQNGEDAVYETNKSIVFDYMDVNYDSATITHETVDQGLDSPLVDPVLLVIAKKLLDENGNIVSGDPRFFQIDVEKSAPNPFAGTVSLQSGLANVWMATLRHEGNYSFAETGITGDGVTNLDAFEITYEINGVEGNSFSVDHDVQIDQRTGMPIPRNDIVIVVTNKRIADADPDNPLIRLSKTFVGLTQAQIDELVDFTITITSTTDATLTQDLTLADAIVLAPDVDGNIRYGWELEGWPAGTYTVTETGEVFPGYTVTVENDGTVTTTAATISWTQALAKKPNTEVNNDLTNGGIRAIPNIVATKLSGGSGVFVWTETRLSASERLAVVNALSGWSELGLTMDNGFWYSGDDIKGTSFLFRGYKIQYNMDTGNLNLPQPNQWALIISGTYAFAGGAPADIAVKNTYVRSTIGFIFTKVNENGQPLLGSAFTLEKVDTDGRTPIANVGVDPVFNFPELEVGSYELTETQAPAGYQLPTDNVWHFEVVQNVAGELEIVFAPGDELEADPNNTGQYLLKNSPQSSFPQTGGAGTFIYTLSGLSIMVASILTYFMYEKKKRNTKKRSKTMTKRINKILTSLVIAAVVFIGIGPAVANAGADPNTPGFQTTVNIHKIETEADAAEMTLEELTNGITDLGAKFGAGAVGLPGVQFQVYSVTKAQFDVMRATPAAFETAAEVVAGGGVLVTTTAATDANGLTSVTLNEGYFWVIEVPLGTIASSRAVPFGLTLPYTAAGGTANLTSIHVYPKNTLEGPPPVDKDIDETDVTQYIGQDFNWTVTSVIPNGIAEYTKYEFVDVIDEKLDYVGVTFVNPAPAAFVLNTDYTVVYDEATRTLTIALTPVGIGKLVEGSTLEYDITTKINNLAVMGQEIENDIVLNFVNPHDEDTAEVPIPPTVVTGGRKFKKIMDNEAGTVLAGAEFVILNAVGEFIVQDATTLVVTFTTDEALATRFISGADGLFEVKGLAFGEYTLREVLAPAGYALPTNPNVAFTVNASSYYVDPTAVELIDAAPTVVVNRRIFIPLTGGSGTLMFTIGGAALMILAVVYYKRTSKKASEEQ